MNISTLNSVKAIIVSLITPLLLAQPTQAQFYNGKSDTDPQNYVGKGASVPFRTLEAEDGSFGGGAKRRTLSIPKKDNVHTPELEASGRALVELSTLGAYVSWINNTGINSNTIVVRSCIPDSPTGGGIVDSINLYINGVFRQSLTLTSKYAWLYGGDATGSNFTNNTPGSFPKRFYDEFRFFVKGLPIANGDRITLRKDIDNTAAFYYIDLIDLEDVEPPKIQPENSVSVTEYGAIPNDGIDDTEAFNKCIARCQFLGATMWIPEGVFQTKGIIKAKNITIAGAGMWHTTHYRTIEASANYRHKFELTDCNVKDLYMFAEGTGREVAQGKDYGMTMNGIKEWTVENVWANNLSVGFWMTGRNGIIRNCRSSSSWGDGININNASTYVDGTHGSNMLIENNFLRGNQDDGIALNAQNGGGTEQNMIGIVIKNNTTVGTIWANGLRIAGGRGTLLKDNYVADVADNNGIKLAIFGENGNPLESIDVLGNVVIRATGVRFIQSGNGGFYISSNSKNVNLQNNIAIDCEVGFLLDRTETILKDNTSFNPFTTGFSIVSSAVGNASIIGNKVINLPIGKKAYDNKSSVANFTVLSMVNNSWQTLPVELLDFQLKLDNNKVAVNWSTASEKNNDYFKIERSSDGINFSELARVSGKSNSNNISNYITYDKNANNGFNYYRLLQYDIDGMKTDYGIKSIKYSLTKNEGLAIYPNPSYGDFSINIGNKYFKKTNILIQNLNGKTIYNQTHIPEDGKINLKINPPAGYYIIKATTNEGDIIDNIIIK